MNSSIHALRMFLVMSAILAATALACSNNYWNKPPQWPHALTRQMCAHSQRSTSRMAGLQAPAASLRDHDIQHNNVHQHTATSTTTSTSMSTSTTSSTTSTSTTSTTSSTTIARCVIREKTIVVWLRSLLMRVRSPSQSRRIRFVEVLRCWRFILLRPVLVCGNGVTSGVRFQDCANQGKQKSRVRWQLP